MEQNDLIRAPSKCALKANLAHHFLFIFFLLPWPMLPQHYPTSPQNHPIHTNHPHCLKAWWQKQTQQPQIAITQANCKPPPLHFTPFSHLFLIFYCSTLLLFSIRQNYHTHFSLNYAHKKTKPYQNTPSPMIWKPDSMPCTFFFQLFSPISYLPIQSPQTP